MLSTSKPSFSPLTRSHARYYPHGASVDQAHCKVMRLRKAMARMYDPAFMCEPFVKYWEWPQDVAEMIRMLVGYYAADTYQHVGRARVSPYRNSIKMARAVLGCHPVKLGSAYAGQRRDLEDLGPDWRARLKAAGWNTYKMEIENDVRWALSWELLGQNHIRGKFYFRPEEVDKAILEGRFIPPEAALKPRPARTIDPQAELKKKTERERPVRQEVARADYVGNVFKESIRSMHL